MACLIKDNKFYTPNGQESRLYKDLEQKVGEQEARELFILSHTPTFQKELKNIDTPTKVINFKGSQAFFKERKSGQIELELIQTPAQNRGKGAGRKVLQEFLKYADSLGKDVRLFVSPRDRQTTAEGLMKFYESVGFRSFDKFLPEEMGRRAKKVTSKQKLITPTANIFYDNGEVKADVLINYANNNFSLTEPLTKEEVLDLSTLQINNVETSEELYEVLKDTFYNKGVFDPNVKKMEKIYSEAEIRNILEDVEIQARILETIEKLRHTEEFNITPIKVDQDFSYKTLTANIIGQYKSNNPLQDKAIYEEQNGGEGFVQVDIIDESGNVVEEKLIYDNAVKVVDDPKILQAIDAIIQAPQVVDTSKLEKKVQKWLLSYGLNTEGLSRENYRTLAEFIRTPTDETTVLLEQSLGFERRPKQPFIKISPENRTYKMLRTTKSENQLFEELSLIKTNTPNVYHQVEKIDEQEMRDIMDNQDLTVPLHELYREYFEYDAVNDATNEVITDAVNVEYLTGEFVADFAAEKLKNPNNEFYQQFKITENGIELISQDEITLAKVKSQIQDYPQLADYSLVSKLLPNLKESTPKTIKTKENRRVKAVNNKQSIPAPKSEVKIIDETFIETENETADFIKIGEDVYEQQEQGIYAKLTFQENPTYFTMNVEAPPYKLVEQKQINSAEKTVKKLTTKEQDEENFNCL
jgi:GNAT superfamily N-acetyltransferase